MKTSLQYKLLQHLRTKQEQGGFTLIELLVVIIIIGILAAIALPSFLNQADRARATEAQNGLGGINRAQQAYLLENGFFSSELKHLDVDLGEADATGNTVEGTVYKFTVADTTAGAADRAQATALPLTAAKVSSFRGCVTGSGAVEIVEKESTGTLLTDTKPCTITGP